MRLTVLALALLPVAAQAQNTTTPAEPLVQAQSCAAGSVWDAAAGACEATPEATPATKAAGGGCSYSAAREVTS